MEDKRQIGIVIRCLNMSIGRAAMSAANEEFGDSATAIHGWVIRYLYENRDHDVFQKDLEQRFSVRRSTMSSILKLMEKNGLITKEAVEKDARLKKLILTPAAYRIEERMKCQIENIEKRMRLGINEQEMKAFLDTAEKISKNLS